MAAKRSAGILLYRRTAELELLLGRLGGPFWKNKRAQNWSIPKGELGPDEDALAAAKREFTEELGLPVPAVDLIDLGETKQRSGKTVQIWAGESDLDVSGAVFGTFGLEWPPKSGVIQQFPELAEVSWTSVEVARDRLIAGQLPFVDRLIDRL